MIGIKINNTFLDLNPKTSISFELNNPIFLGDQLKAIEGSFSFPTTIPLTNKNREVLDFPDVIENHKRLLSKGKAQVFFQNKLLFTGDGYVQSSGRKNASLYIIIEGLQGLKDLVLNEIDYGGAKNYPGIVALAKDTADNPLNYDFIFFPVMNRGFWPDGEEPGAFGDDEYYVQNYFDPSTQTFVESATQKVATPFVRVDYVINKIFETAGLLLNNRFQITDELRKMVLYNNYSIYDGNVWSEFIDIRNHLPEKKAVDFVKGLASYFCLGIIRKNFSNEVSLVPLKDLLRNTYQHDWTNKAAAEYNKSGLENTLNSQFCFEETGEKSIYAESYNGLQYRKLKDAVVVEYFSDIPFGSPLLPVGGFDDTIYYVDQDGYYYWFANNVGILQGALGYYRCYDAELNDTEYTSNISTTFRAYNQNDILEMPMVVQAGSIPDLQLENDFPLKVMFYRGMYPNDATLNFPYANHHAFRDAGKYPGVQVGEHSLIWQGETGVFNQWWSEWYDMLSNGSEVDRDLLLTIDDIISFDFEEKVRISNMDYFVKKLNITLTNFGIKPVKAKLLSVR